MNADKTEKLISLTSGERLVYHERGRLKMECACCGEERATATGQFIVGGFFDDCFVCSAECRRELSDADLGTKDQHDEAKQLGLTAN